MYSDETIKELARGYGTATALVRRFLTLLEQTSEQKALRAAPAKDTEWDHSIHANPSAQAWAAAFAKMYPTCNVPEDVMLGWFANAMMAMHDFLKGGGPMNGDHAQFLLDQDAAR